MKRNKITENSNDFGVEGTGLIAKYANNYIKKNN